MEELLPLHLLERGQAARIEELVGQDDDLVHRLQELGLRIGVAIEMIQPGSPCIVRVDQRKLCFRDADVFRILVRPGTPS